MTHHIPKTQAFAITALALLALALPTIASSPLPTAAIAVPATPVIPPLTVMLGASITRSEDGTGMWDAGMVDPARTPSIAQTFVIRNTSPQPVAITRLRAACGCTSLLLSGKDVTGTYATLKPGAETQVRMTLRVQGQPPGTLHKYAWIYGAGETPLATLAINVTVRPAAALSPPFVNFGTISQGVSRTMPLSVTVADSAVTGKSFPTLVSSNPAVLVVAAGTPQPTLRDGEPSLVQQFQVVLTPHAPAGPLTGRLFLIASPTDQEASVSSSPPGTAPLPLFDVMGGVTGQVTGRLTVTPQSLFFGSVPAGRPATRQVILTVASTDASQSLTATSGNRWLTARLLPSSSTSTGMRLLAVTLSAGAPTGPLQSQITVQDAAGERLVLPVYADLSSAP